MKYPVSSLAMRCVRLVQLKPDEIVYGSQKKVWWKCGKGDDHEWPAIVRTRTLQGYGCPICSGHKPSKGNSLFDSFPDIVKKIDFERSNVDPKKNARHASIKLWWKCKRGPSWKAPVNRSKGKEVDLEKLAELSEKNRKEYGRLLTKAQAIVSKRLKDKYIDTDYEDDLIDKEMKIFKRDYVRTARKKSIQTNTHKLIKKAKANIHAVENGAFGVGH